MTGLLPPDPHMTTNNATAFPVGMKVLLVDQRVCLRILSCMLKTCGYHVTECEQHKEALELLRESKFDLVISNVSNASESDIDGLKLLEFVGLEMDLPLIIVSSDSSRETIMKAIQHGACDYLIKPIQQKEVAIIWKHVVRRKNINKAVPESSGSLEKINSSESFRRQNDDANGDVRQSRKKKRGVAEDDDGELENGEESRKKGRFNWNGERHKQFVSAVNQLGVNNAVPKKILSVLNIPGLKREHVASHLQKYRMGLRKAEKEKQGQQFQHVNSLIGVNLNPVMGPASKFSFQTLPSRPATWNNHAPNIMPHLPTMPQIESNSNDMLWNVAAPEQLPVHHMSMNPLLSNQNYALRNMQPGSNDTLYTGNNLLGFRSTTSQPSLFASRNRGFNGNANAFNGSLGSGFVQNGYCQAWGGTDRTESPTSNLTCGNSDTILNTNSWDLDSQM